VSACVLDGWEAEEQGGDDGSFLQGTQRSQDPLLQLRLSLRHFLGYLLLDVRTSGVAQSPPAALRLGCRAKAAASRRFQRGEDLVCLGPDGSGVAGHGVAAVIDNEPKEEPSPVVRAKLTTFAMSDERLSVVGI